MAQVVDPTTAAQRPIAGVGHDYIGTGSEMVNPADGSISFNLPFNTPPGRGLSFPFSITFNSNEPFYLSSGGTSTFTWETANSNGQNSPFSQDGWSYSLPHYTALPSVVFSEPYNCSPSSQCSTYNYCWATQGYTFVDLQNVSHTLDLANSWIGPASANPYTQDCQGDGFVGYGGSYTGRSFDGIQASFADTPAAPTQPSVTVTDTSGTVYNFPQIVSDISGSSFGSLAQTITDRNGNQIVFKGSSGPVTNAGPPAGSYTDTAGRSVVGWSGLGSTSGDQISISGLPSNIVVKWQQITISLPLNSTVLSGSSCGIGGNNKPITQTVVSEIDLPNKKAYTFTYADSKYGLLSKVTFPDGGYIRYVWGASAASKVTYQEWIVDAPNVYSNATCMAAVDTPAVSDRYVSFDGSTETLHQHFSYSTQLNSSSSDWAKKITTVTSTDTTTNLQKTVTYTYLPGAVNLGVNDQTHALPAKGYPAYTTYLNWQTPTVPLESKIVTTDVNGHILQTVNKLWQNQYVLTGDQTVLDSGQGMTTLRCADPADNIIDVFEYDFQANGAKPADPSCTTSSGLTASAIGPLLRHTATVYHSFSGTNIRDEPDTVTVTDGQNNKISQTVYGYDTGSLTASNVASGFKAVSGSRGNTTTVARWLNTTNTSLTTTYSYFDTGQVQSRQDPCGSVTCADMVKGGHTTTYSYQDSPAGSTQTNSYLTALKDPLGHSQEFTYDYPSGRMLSATDSNSQTTTYAYTDPLLRLTDVYSAASAQNGGIRPHTVYTYVDGPHSTMKTTEPTGIVTLATRDGMDRVLTVATTSAPGGSILVDTTYDGEGNVRSVSNPYQTNTSPSYGITSYLYDPLNRRLDQCQPDNSSSASSACTPSNNFLSWSYIGATTIYTDEKRNGDWLRTTDALGRLTNVIEPGGQTTQYTYDLLDNLTGVAQTGVSGETPRNRSFAYDSLSRLVTSFNPESGFTCYGTVTSGQVPNATNCTEGYDANANLSVKTTSQPDVQGNAMVVSYSYDVLNRLTKKIAPTDYDNLNAAFSYDQGANGIGRLSAENRNTVGGEAYTYDEMGRVAGTTFIQYHQNNAATGMGVSYDLGGHPTKLTYPDGRVVGQSWDLAGRLQSITDQTSGGSALTYFSTPSAPLSTFSAPATEYWPSGALANVQLGPAITGQFALNSRLQPSGYASGSSFVGGASGTANVTNRQMFYLANTSSSGNCAATASHNNGNMYSIVDLLNSGLTQTFSYDNLNRLSCAMRSDQTYSTNYLYDSFGNMRPYNNLVSSTEELNYSIDPATNRLLLNQTDFTYDSAGNLTSVPNALGGSHTFTYTGEAFLRCVDGCSAGSYIVDALGQRTYASRSGATTQYVYLNGQPMAEYSSLGYWTDYIYANSAKIARVESVDAPIHLSGTNCTSCGGAATYVALTSGAGRVIQNGDSLNLAQYAAGAAQGGVILNFTDGSRADGYTYDVEGQQINCDSLKNQWHQRHIDLSSFAGKTLQSTYLINDGCSSAGQFDIYFNDVAISGNGSVSTIYSPQHGAKFSAVDAPDWPGRATNVTAVAQSNSSAPGSGTHFYLDDNLGTAEIEFAAGGWPTWLGQFTPFGQEIVNSALTQSLGSQPPDGTSMHFKFGGKESDQESGLDYFGARYYASNTGRWITPDWASKPEAVPYSDLTDPQSLNLYGYVRNNPLSKVDADGHECCDNLLQFTAGVVQGAASSVSFGLVGSPRSSDSNASLAGQLLGTSIIGGSGTSMVSGSGPAALGGLALAPETGGASLGVAVAASAVGSDLAAGAARNGAAITVMMSSRTGDFTKGEKKAMDSKNAADNGGVNKCSNCGQEVRKVQSKAGEPTPGDQLQRHHDPPLTQRDPGTKSLKDRILCKDCHVQEHRK